MELVCFDIWGISEARSLAPLMLTKHYLDSPRNPNGQISPLFIVVLTSTQIMQPHKTSHTPSYSLLTMRLTYLRAGFPTLLTAVQL